MFIQKKRILSMNVQSKNNSEGDKAEKHRDFPLAIDKILMQFWKVRN